MNYVKYAVIIFALLALAGGCKKSSSQSEEQESSEGQVSRGAIEEYGEEYPVDYELDLETDAEGGEEESTVELVVLSDWIARQAEEQFDISIRDDEIAMYGIIRAAREALANLETQEQTQVNVPLLTADDEAAKEFQVTVTRQKVEELLKSNK
jgi:hypothetical protein